MSSVLRTHFQVLSVFAIVQSIWQCPSPPPPPVAVQSDLWELSERCTSLTLAEFLSSCHTMDRIDVWWVGFFFFFFFPRPYHVQSILVGESVPGYYCGPDGTDAARELVARALHPFVSSRCDCLGLVACRGLKCTAQYCMTWHSMALHSVGPMQQREVRGLMWKETELFRKSAVLTLHDNAARHGTAWRCTVIALCSSAQCGCLHAGDLSALHSTAAWRCTVLALCSSAKCVD